MPRTVLVADDSELIRKLLCRLFESEEDYELCAVASNGEEAIALAVIHKPDLIILDISMPVMNGFQAAKKLKQILPQTPILLFTQHADLRPMFENVPADRIVSKIDIVSLMKHVRELAPV
jgi:CheY-like chemotaxis protein